METKKCKDCKLVLPLSDYYSRVGRRGNTIYHSYCKECHKKRNIGNRRGRPWEETALGAKRDNAKKMGIEFDITLEDLGEPPTHCPVLGIELQYKGGKRNAPNLASIDRIDSSKGYVKGNVAIVSYRANTLKRDATLQELEKLVEYLRSI